MPQLAIAEYPGVIMMDSNEEVRKKVESVLVDRIIEGLGRPIEKIEQEVEPGPHDIVFKGTIDGVNDFFDRQLWTDGLPVVPPTLDRIERFLAFTDRQRDEVIGVLLPENREATLWNIAANGVMAGCRPEYMPILIAVVEAIAEPLFRIEDAGSTPGWEPLIILNGPIIKELGFNYGSGVMRVGPRPNSSIGRFLRLYMRNIPGLRTPPGQTDKGSIGYTFNVVLAENEDAARAIGWEPFSVDQGFAPGENIATVQSVVYISPPLYTGGDKATDHLETITEIIGRRTIASWSHLAIRRGKYYPLLVLSPSIAGAIARDGLTKDDIRNYLFEHALTPAGVLERIAWQGGHTDFTLCGAVEEGIASPVYGESRDPERLVPAFLRPEWIGIVVSGDPGRNQCKAYVQNHIQGPPTSKKIELPSAWQELRK